MKKYTSESLFRDICDICPDLKKLGDEHLSYYEEILITIFLEDEVFRDFFCIWIEISNFEKLKPLLDLLDEYYNLGYKDDKVTASIMFFLESIVCNKFINKVQEQGLLGNNLKIALSEIKKSPTFNTEHLD